MSTNNVNNARFLQEQKPKLKKRLIEHLTLRENKIKNILEKSIIHLNELGYVSTIQISKYDESFVDIDQIDNLINNWKGLHITRPLSQGQFHSKSNNWVDQNSKKISGPYFFAMHFKKIKSYLMHYCEHINLPASKLKLIQNYSCIYFAVELLNGKVEGFTRCRSQPLIRNKTLTQSKEVHESFSCLCNNSKLDVIKLIKIVKKNNKQKNQLKKGNQTTRIVSKEFVENLRRYCTDLLKQAQIKLQSVRKNKAVDVLIPLYFQEYKQKEHVSKMKMNMHKKPDNSLNNTINNSISTNKEMLSTQQHNNIGYQYPNGICTDCIPPPIDIDLGYTTSNDNLNAFMPLINSQFDDDDMIFPTANTYYDALNDVCSYPSYPSCCDPYQAAYYGSERGGYYMGSSSGCRYTPYDVAPIPPYYANNTIYNSNNTVINVHSSPAMINKVIPFGVVSCTSDIRYNTKMPPFEELMYN